MLTETKLRQIIRKMILEVTSAEAEQFTSMAGSSREKPASQQVSHFKGQLGTNDKDFTSNIQKLQDLIHGGKPIDPTVKDQVDVLIQKAINLLK